MNKIEIFNIGTGVTQVWTKNANDWRYIKRTNVKTWRSRVKLSDKLKGARS